MKKRAFFFFFFSLFLPLIFSTILPISLSQQLPAAGDWRLLQKSIGISAMHMQLIYTNEVVMFDRTDFGPSNLSFPDGRCRLDPNDTALKIDCTAHSLIYDVPSNTVRPLTIQTDTWCSSGSVLPNGTLVQTGGYNDGDRVVRTLAPCVGGPLFQDCDWIEKPNYLSVRRWYATNQILHDGRVIIVGGRRQFSYEFFPRSASEPANYWLGFLKETWDVDENNLYPFLHLLPDGSLFIFANDRAIRFDYVNDRVVREYPPIPGRDPRNYPSSGSSVLLPLHLDGGDGVDGLIAEVMVCGGAPRGAFGRAKNRTFLLALSSCGRLMVTDLEVQWKMEEMPMARVMGDMLLVPTGDVVIINGAANGTSGWELARNPITRPVLYHPSDPMGHRFQILSPSPIARVYHSSSVMLPDGRILVGGSNPHVHYNFTGVDYPTELSIEAFSPPYLAMQYARFRPQITFTVPHQFISYGQPIAINFLLTSYMPQSGLSVTMLAPSFTTHSIAMNQRLLMLKVTRVAQASALMYQVNAIGPPTATIAPPGYYMLFVVHAGVPSPGIWVRMQ
ncbi:aldehyde oxidase GLOX-like [Magnolia sinica]|uniref:aldehyde oxidase GLOX-like n=1 Tax=Magnolia sinica TaxID=86752 RepID=UPI00265A0EC2|nr:aldehyde oxidase GLOX-like [Magnolia sinica]